MRKHIITLCLLVLVAGIRGASAQTVLDSFENTAGVDCVTTSDATVAVTTQDVTNGKYALAVKMMPGNWPSVYVNAPAPWNIDSAGAVAVDVTNSGSVPVTLYMEIYDSKSTKADEQTRCSSPATLAPGQEATLYMPLVAPPTPMNYGMVALPPYPDSYVDVNCWGSSPFDLTHLSQIELFATSVSSVTNFVMDNVRTLPAFEQSSLDGIVDQYGQSTLTTWTDKVQADSGFAANQATEDEWLAQHPAPADRDSYGGWKTGPTLASTGFFHTTQYNGKWWLVTPSGHLFFATGIDGIAPANPTFVQDRTYMFQSLPAANSALGAYYSTATAFSGPVASGTAYDFSQANLERKYGSAWAEPWLARADQRLAAWGFNTIGAWSDPTLCKLDKIPYVVEESIYGTYNTVSSGSDAWGPMEDPFDPRFATATANCLKDNLGAYAGDPWCIGYFIDNEPSWGTSTDHYGLAYGALAQNAATSSSAKTAFISELETKYGTIAKFNSAWGTKLTSWTSLNAPFTPPSTTTSAMTSDMSAFLLAYAEAYFKTVSTALHNFDSKHLYLGCRFASTHWTPEALQAATQYCDVLSFNIYANTVDPSAWSMLSGLPKPAMVGEYSFGATDRGMFDPGQVNAGSQAARGTDMQTYFQSVLSNPQFVGLQWYQYQDQPVTGTTFDGENGNYGFIDVTDTPYTALVNAANASQQTLYETRNGTQAASTRG